MAKYNRKYHKTTGYWVYAHTTPDKLVYFGISIQQPCKRWQPLMYKTTALASYIEQYGWNNIEHRVLIDNLTKEQAEQIEDWFIHKATADGFCINERRSGGIERDNINQYRKQYQKQWYEEHKEERKEYFKQRLSTPEGRIYDRVKTFNRCHTPIETPMEAKMKYIETGYIPDYIKNDDLM